MKRAPVSKHKPFWTNRGYFPLFIGFCPSPKAWAEVMTNLKVDLPYPTGEGSCTSLTKGRRSVALVTLAPEVDQRTLIEVVGLVTHEAQHVYQYLLDAMGEKQRPSPEFEAYTVQNITQDLFEAYCATRRPRWLKLK